MLARLAMFLGLVVGGSDALAATPVPLEVYTRPAQLVSLPDGRRMNLLCLGAGTPTVVLDAGWGSGNSTWAPIHAALAETTRVCAFDRAGMGFSDVGPMPRDSAAMVADERGMLKAAKLPGPYVFVGHSHAAFNVRLYASLYPTEVAGVVLVDPSMTFWAERLGAIAPAARVAMEASDAKRRTCADRVIAGGFDATSPGFAACYPPPPPSLPEPVREVLVARQLNKDMHRTMNSELDSEPADSALVESHKRPLGGIPLIVLTGVNQGGQSSVPDAERAAVAALRDQLHGEIAALSVRGEQRRIAASHYVWRESPEAVISAVNDVVTASRKASSIRLRRR